jgi:hypothetical protein
MVWWQTLVVALASSVSGGLLVSSGNYFLYRQQRRHEEREQALSTIGSVLAALREIDPDVYVERLRVDERGRELIADKRARWLSAVDRLEILRARQPVSEVSDLAKSVIKKGTLVLIRLDEMVGAGRAVSTAWLEAIPPRYQEAVEEAERLAQLLAR